MMLQHFYFLVARILYYCHDLNCVAGSFIGIALFMIWSYNIKEKKTPMSRIWTQDLNDNTNLL